MRQNGLEMAIVSKDPSVLVPGLMDGYNYIYDTFSSKLRVGYEHGLAPRSSLSRLKTKKWAQKINIQKLCLNSRKKAFCV